MGWAEGWDSEESVPEEPRGLRVWVVEEEEEEEVLEEGVEVVQEEEEARTRRSVTCSRRL